MNVRCGVFAEKPTIDATRNSIAMLEIAVQALGDLCESLVFVGGCATGLRVTTVRAHQIRATEDVDVVAVATVSGYHDVEARLSARGFKHDISPEAPICRWIGAGTTLDLMPSEPGVLSFHNRWYPLAADTAQSVQLPSGHDIAIGPVLHRNEAGGILGSRWWRFLGEPRSRGHCDSCGWAAITAMKSMRRMPICVSISGSSSGELTAPSHCFDARPPAHQPIMSQARLPVRRLRILAQEVPLPSN